MTAQAPTTQSVGTATDAARVTLDALTKAYVPGEPTVDAVDLTFEPGSLTTLLGPSGCGKTTTLKMLAGLLAPTSGDITIAGTSVVRMPAERRPVAMVFQKPLLFPHLSVGDNVAFGLRMRRVHRAERRRRVSDMLDLVRLSGFEGRRAGELSGGQEQRVSLARALVVRPRVLLLDEPLSQLDAGLRVEMRELVRTVQREVAVTTVFVTHDQEEAAAVSDRIALMLDGRIEAEGDPEQLWSRPATERAARFLGTGNLLRGSVSGGRFTGPLGVVRAPGVRDGPAVLALRQEALDVEPEPGGHHLRGSRAIVTAARFLGTGIRLDLRLDDGTALLAIVPPTSRFAVGDRCDVGVHDGAGHVLAAS